MDDKAEGAWNPMGHLDTAAADRISGWAAPKQGIGPVTVEIYIGERKYAECIAAEARSDVLSADGMPLDRCGFTYRCSLEQIRGPARVFVRIKGEDGFLPGSGQFLQPLSGPMDRVGLGSSVGHELDREFRGHVDSISSGPDRVSGWAVVNGTPTPATIEILLDGHRKIAEGWTKFERPDVAKALGDHAACSGFIAGCDLSKAGYNSRIFAAVTGFQGFLRGSGKFVYPLPESERKLFFIHIPKTGGNTLNWIAKFLYPRANDHLETQGWRDSEAFTDFQYLSGHLPLSEAMRLYAGKGFAFFTILRDPQDQFLSHLRWQRDYPTLDPLGARMAAKLGAAGAAPTGQVGTLKLLLSDNDLRVQILDLFDNCMTRYLASVPPTRPVQIQDVPRAKDALLELDGIGILERFPETLDRLNSLTGHPWQDHRDAWENKSAESLARLSRLAGRSSTQVAPSGARGEGPAPERGQINGLLEEFIWADREVYRFALEIFDGKEPRGKIVNGA